MLVILCVRIFRFHSIARGEKGLSWKGQIALMTLTFLIGNHFAPAIASGESAMKG